MQGITESCTVCTRTYEVQFRYQMEERDGGFVFFCSQECQSKEARGETTDGVTCDACSKRFVVELVSQMVKGTKGTRKYACSDACRTQVLAEVNGARLGALTAPPPVVAAAPAPVPESAPAPVPEPRPSSPVVGVVSVAPPPVGSVTASSRARMAIHGPKRLAIFNHKGGTGKTTTVRQHCRRPRARGAAGAPRRHRLAGQRRRSPSASRRSARSTTCSSWGCAPRPPSCTVRPNLDLIASNETLAAAELYLAGTAEPRPRPRAIGWRRLFDGVRRRRPRLLALAVAHEPERARRRGRRPRAGRLRLPLARRRPAGHQDGEERQRSAPPSGADRRRPADVLRRARAHLPRRPRRR